MLTVIGFVVGIGLALWGGYFFLGSLFAETGTAGVLKKKTSLMDAAIMIFGLAIITFVVIYFFRAVITGVTSNVYTWVSGQLDNMFNKGSIIDIMPKPESQQIFFMLPGYQLAKKFFRRVRKFRK